MQPYSDITDPRVVKALAHPVRAQVLGALHDRVASPNELSRELGVSLGSVSYHVNRLVGLGFLELVGKTPRRGAIEHYYTAISRPRIADAVWAEVPPIVKRAVVGAALEIVARDVNAAAAVGGFDIADAHLARWPLILDAEGWHAVAAELEAAGKSIERIAADSAERLDAAGGAGRTEAEAVLMLFCQAPLGADAVPAPGHHRPARRAEPTLLT